MIETAKKPDRRVAPNTPEQEAEYHRKMAVLMKKKGYEALAAHHDMLSRKGSL